MRCPARFIAATALAAVSLVPLSVASRAAGAQPSLPSALASFLAEEEGVARGRRYRVFAGGSEGGAGHQRPHRGHGGPADAARRSACVWIGAPSSRARRRAVRHPAHPLRCGDQEPWPHDPPRGDGDTRRHARSRSGLSAQRCSTGTRDSSTACRGSYRVEWRTSAIASRSRSMCRATHPSRLTRCWPLTSQP